MGPKANVTYTHITAATAHSLLRGEAAYSELQATEIYLDAYSTNRYISGDFSALTDALAVATTKLPIDSFGLTESQVIALAKEATDSSSITDLFGRAVVFARHFTDAFALDEAVLINPNTGVNKSNIFSFTDTFSYQMVTGNNSVLNSSALNTYTLSS